MMSRTKKVVIADVVDELYLLNSVPLAFRFIKVHLKDLTDIYLRIQGFYDNLMYTYSEN